jgi:hypothetical protein
VSVDIGGKSLSKGFQAMAEAGRLRRMMRHWRRRDYAAPSPHAVKQAVLRRHHVEGAAWVETGTASGDTTAFLSGFAPRVYTIEPQREFHRAAVARFARLSHVEPLLGTSEEIFPELIDRLAGDLCFWLDGHYSGGSTFEAAMDTPIRRELEVLARHLPRLGRVAVLIDDIRCFDPELPDFRDYPPLDDLVDWARQAGLKWHIEHDILIARTP